MSFFLVFSTLVHPVGNFPQGRRLDRGLIGSFVLNDATGCLWTELVPLGGRAILLLQLDHDHTVVCAKISPEREVRSSVYKRK